MQNIQQILEQYWGYKSFRPLQENIINSVLIDLFEIQRKELVKLRLEKKFSDEELRKQERQIDYEEAKLSPSLE